MQQILCHKTIVLLFTRPKSRNKEKTNYIYETTDGL